MKPKSKLLIIAGILIGIPVLFFICVYMSLRGHLGVAKDISELAEVYQAAGPEFAAFYTNSFLQKIPFNQPIAWRRTTVRTWITLTSSVDVVAFKKAMADETFRGFFGHTFSIEHRFGETVMRTHGTIDLQSGAFFIHSSTMGRLIGDYEWQRMTNGSATLSEFEKKW